MSLDLGSYRTVNFSDEYDEEGLKNPSAISAVADIALYSNPGSFQSITYMTQSSPSSSPSSSEFSFSNNKNYEQQPQQYNMRHQTNQPYRRTGAKHKNQDRPDENRINYQTRNQSAPSYNQLVNNTPHFRHQMESFVPEKVTDFKHVIYNLLVDNHNNPEKFSFVQPCAIKEKGITKIGFCFNEKENPDKKLPELYALHIRKARLDLEDSSSVFIQDLYKYYLRACVELLSKYFEKLDKYTYLYEDLQLFIPNGSLEEAEQRMKAMKTRSRKKRMKSSN